MSGLSDGTKGSPMDPQSSQNLATGPSMAEASQSLATGSAAGPTASSSFGAGTSPDYDKGESATDTHPGMQDGGDVALPNETDDSLGSAGAPDMSRSASLQDASRGGYSTSGDAEIKGAPRSDPSE